MSDLAPPAEPDAWLLRLSVALAIGLLIGLERGWKERGEPEGGRTAGLRTFGLIGLFGGLSALLASAAGIIILAAALVVLAAAMITFELLNALRDKNNDATPVVAQLLVFMLGAAAGFGHLQEAGAAAVAATIILAFKENLHRWLERLTFSELRAALVLAAMSVIVLPLLPGEPIDPWGAVSLRSIWLLMLLIAAISFVGYAAIRIAGPKRGPLAAGLAGGLVSSTATVIGFARLAKTLDRASARPVLAGALLANAVMFVRTAVLAAALRNELSIPVLAALIPAALASLVAALILSLGPRAAAKDGAASLIMSLDNPFSLRTAFFFGALLAVVAIASAASNDAFGAAATIVVAAVSGLADADAVTLTMAQTANISAPVAAFAIIAGATSNTVSKAILAALAGGRHVGAVIAACSAVTLAAGGLGCLTWYLAGQEITTLRCILGG